jgi:hypothetical protein
MLNSPRVKALCVAALGCLCAYLATDLVLHRVTTYAVICLEQVKNGRCESLGRTLDSATFTVSAERQQVWTSENGHTIALTACHVTSRRDWRCRGRDGTSELGITAGRPWLSRGQGRESDLVFVSAWRYWWLKTGEPRPSGSGRMIFR